MLLERIKLLQSQINQYLIYSPDNKKWDKNKSFYVGDALGRKEDWSDVDKKFAENIGIKYYSPDEIFATTNIKSKNITR